MFDVVFVRGTEAEGGYGRLAVEEIGTTGISDEAMGDSRFFCLRLRAQQGVEISCLKADLGAGKIFEIFREENGKRCLAAKECA